MDINPLQSDGTRISVAMTTIQQRIASRSLMPGDRLPSIRSLAKTLQMSTSTIVEAYERLVAEGAIRSRPGSGFYVAAPLAPLDLTELSPRRERAIDPFWVSRQSLEADDAVLKPGCGWLPPSWLPEAGLRRTLRTLARGTLNPLADYDTPLGLLPLRQLLARQLGERGVALPPEGILLTESGTQAIDMLCRLLLEPGDVVALDDPCYFNFQALLRAHRVRLVGVPYTPSGPDLAAFERVVAEARPRLYITNAGIHNPTGATLSPVVAHRLLTLAERYGVTIIEDDIFADFEDVPAPRLAAFGGLERVVTIGSFSKTLSASARCGFIAARPDWLSALVDLKIATTFGGGRLSAEVVLGVLQSGSYRKHMEGLRVRLTRARRDTAARLGGVGIEPWLEPQAGMFLWCLLPDGRDAAEVARAALEEDIVLAPGNVFSLSQTARDSMRFNVAQSSDPRLYEVLRRILG